MTRERMLHRLGSLSLMMCLSSCYIEAMPLEECGRPWYPDVDADGFGDPEVVVQACVLPPGHVAIGMDCDDENPAVHPAAAETCNDIDDNCNGAADDADPYILDRTTANTWYLDGDSDGLGDADMEWLACDQPAGYVTRVGDCDDQDASVHGDAAEICNGIDDDCDGAVDDDDDSRVEASIAVWYADRDQDGWGEEATQMRACARPAGYVPVPGDCSDTDAAVNPGMPETCNGGDDDCDGSVDVALWYADTDGDGYGDPSMSQEACAAPAGFVSNGDDCDDEDELVHPWANEICDGKRNDCTDAAWTNDDGRVSRHVESSDAWLDETAQLTAGAPGQPVTDYILPAGSTLRFCPGTYYVSLRVALGPQQHARIEGRGTPEETVLSAERAGRVLDVQCPAYTCDLQVSGLIITGGDTTGHGGGIHAPFTRLTLEHTHVLDNHADLHGGGIYVVGSFTTRNARIENNYSSLWGGGVYQEEGTLNMHDTALVGNQAMYAGGMYSGTRDRWMERVVFAENQAVVNGGGLYLDHGVAVVKDSRFEANRTAGDGGAVFISYENSLFLTNTDVSGNIAARNGGGVLSFSGSMYLEAGTQIHGNHALNGNGGGLYLDPRVLTPVTLTSAAIHENTAFAGGGIFGRGQIRCASAPEVETRAGVYGNAIDPLRDPLPGTEGPDVYLSGASGTLTSEGCDWADPVASTPGTLYVAGTSYSFGDDATFACAVSGSQPGCHELAP